MANRTKPRVREENLVALKEARLAELKRAIINGNKSRVLALLRKVGVNAKDRVMAETPLHWAAAAGRRDMVKLLLSRGAVQTYDWMGIHPIHDASKNDDPALIRALVKAGADVNQETSKKMTPLHEAVKNHSVKSVKALLELGANPNAQNEYGTQAIHLLVLYDGKKPNARKAMLKLLAKHGANLNAPAEMTDQLYEDAMTQMEYCGKTPLRILAQGIKLSKGTANAKRDYALAKEFVRLGATLDAKDHSSRTPGEYARGKREQPLSTPKRGRRAV